MVSTIIGGVKMVDAEISFQNEHILEAYLERLADKAALARSGSGNDLPKTTFPVTIDGKEYSAYIAYESEQMFRTKLAVFYLEESNTDGDWYDVFIVDLRQGKFTAIQKIRGFQTRVESFGIHDDAARLMR